MNRLLKGELKNSLMIVLGLLFSTFAYNAFLIPNNIAAGGFTGIAQLVHNTRRPVKADAESPLQIADGGLVLVYDKPAALFEQVVPFTSAG